MIYCFNHYVVPTRNSRSQTSTPAVVMRNQLKKPARLTADAIHRYLPFHDHWYFLAIKYYLVFPHPHILENGYFFLRVWKNMRFYPVNCIFGSTRVNTQKWIENAGLRVQSMRTRALPVSMSLWRHRIKKKPLIFSCPQSWERILKSLMCGQNCPVEISLNTFCMVVLKS